MLTLLDGGYVTMRWETGVADCRRSRILASLLARYQREQLGEVLTLLAVQVQKYKH